MRKVYWRILSHGNGRYTVQFWQQLDESDAIKDTFVSIEADKLHRYIENTLGLKRFELIRMVK